MFLVLALGFMGRPVEEAHERFDFAWWGCFGGTALCGARQGVCRPSTAAPQIASATIFVVGRELLLLQQRRDELRKCAVSSREDVCSLSWQLGGWRQLPRYRGDLEGELGRTDGVAVGLDDRMKSSAFWTVRTGSAPFCGLWQSPLHG